MGLNATLKSRCCFNRSGFTWRKDGKGLKINTYGAHNESTYVVTVIPIDGSIFRLLVNTLKFNDTSLDSITLSPKIYYFFPGITGAFDILSKALGKVDWFKTIYYKAEKLSVVPKAYKGVTVTTKMDLLTLKEVANEEEERTLNLKIFKK